MMRRDWLVSLGFVTVAALVRSALDPWLGTAYPYTAFYAAIAAAAWVGGARTGVLAATIGGVLAMYLFVPRRMSFSVSALPDSIGLALYAIVAVTLIAFGEAMHRARRRAEAGRDRANVIVRSMADGVIVTDAGGRVETMNAAAEALTAWSPRQTPGSHIEAVLPTRHPEHGSRVADAVRQAIVTGEPVATTSDIWLQSPQGGPDRIIEHTVAPIRGSEREVSGAVVILRDETDRRAAEAALEHGERRWKQITESLPQLVWTCDADGSCDYLSPQWAAYTGVPEQVQLGSGWLDAVHPEDRTRVVAAWEASFRSRQTFETNCRIRRSDGVYRSFQTRAIPLCSSDGGVTKWFGTNTDIEDTQQALERVRLSAERFRSLVTATISVVWSVDERGEMNGPQQSWSDYTGQREPDYQGHGWLDAIAADDRPAFLQAWQQGRLAAQLFRVSGRLWHADTAVYRHFEARGVPVLNADGSIREWIGKFMDIEEERKAERRVYDLMTELREADRQKDEFLATLSHELRGPMAPIRNAAGVLAKVELPPPFDSARDAIGRQVTLMARLADDLLDLSRITANTFELRRQPVSIADVLELAMEIAKPAVSEAGHTLIVTMPDVPVWVDGDHARLAQVFANLVTNAAKFMAPGGRIAITAVVREADWVTVRVRDWGEGLASEALPRIFDRFYQARTARQGRAGLGIGLSLVKYLVERHGGTVSAHSEGPGMGSEFIVSMPVTANRAAASVSPEPSETAERRSATQRRVLVVDDNVDSAQTLATLLQLNGYAATAVHSGADALKAVDASRPDVVLLDLGMPGMDGYEVCRRLRERHDRGKLVILALTGWGQERDIRRTRQEGFDHHVTKPVDLSELLTLIERTPVY
jgi:PAS domain S-box-containing protein